MSIRTLDDGERRRMAAKVLAAAKGATGPESRSTAPRPQWAAARYERGRQDSARCWKRHPGPARRPVPLLLELLEKLDFRAAFCAAAMAWGVALALSLVGFEVVRW